MNKYLEKVAERFELEPGVFYDKTRHDVVLSRDRGNQEADAADTRKRLGWGAYGGAVGGIAGAAVGLGVSREHIRRRAPRSYEEWTPPADERVDYWKSTRPTPPYERRPSLAEQLDTRKMRDPVTGRVDLDKMDRVMNKYQEVNAAWAKHDEALSRWRINEPRGDYRRVTKVPDIKPTIVNKIADKIGAGKALKLFTAGGAAAGGLGLGGLYYAFNSATPAERTAAKDAYITKALKRHDNTINQLEGWE